jgi:hypothetical protein
MMTPATKIPAIGSNIEYPFMLPNSPIKTADETAASLYIMYVNKAIKTADETAASLYIMYVNKAMTINVHICIYGQYMVNVCIRVTIHTS